MRKCQHSAKKCQRRPQQEGRYRAQTRARTNGQKVRSHGQIARHHEDQERSRARHWEELQRSTAKTAAKRAERERIAAQNLRRSAQPENNAEELARLREEGERITVEVAIRNQARIVQEIAERDRIAAEEARRNTVRIVQEIAERDRRIEVRTRRRAVRERIVQEQARITHIMRSATDNQTKKGETERKEQEQVRLSSFKILH
jgi:hypothetical protein